MNQLAEHNIKVICIIPAAGNSSRFKSGNKLNAFLEETEDVISRMSKLTKSPLVDTYDLKGLRNSIPKIPTSTWGKMVDRYLDTYQSEMDNQWGFLNAATDVLWHNEKPTVSSFNHNQYITDSLLSGVAA